MDFFEFRTDRLVSIRVQMENGVLTVLVPRRRVLNNNTYVFVLWMTGSSLLLFGVATAYLRSQVRTVRRLAQAADSLGKGQEGPDFPAEGAFEVRQAVRAFNIMRDRIQRQITQRTDMLAGVSHDLRTPLASLQGYLETLIIKDDVLSVSERRAYLETVSRHAERLGKLVVELFELAKLGHFIKRHANTINLIRTAAHTHRQLHRRREIFLFECLHCLAKTPQTPGQQEEHQ